MEIKNYENNPQFARNEAIYMLHIGESLSLQDIAVRFHLAADEIKEIIHMHAQYEAAVLKVYSEGL